MIWYGMSDGTAQAMRASVPTRLLPLDQAPSLLRVANMSHLAGAQRRASESVCRAMVAAAAGAACARRIRYRGVRKVFSCSGHNRGLVRLCAMQADAVSTDRPWELPGYRGAVVSAMADSMPAVVLFAVFAALGVCTYACCATLGEAVANGVPSFVTSCGAAFLGLVFMAGGAAHFGLHEAYCNTMPHRGAWGVWQLPGSASFHVYWTGVAEILGGLGLLLAVVPFIEFPVWLGPLAASGLFALTLAITPSNVYCATHNAPTPGPPAKDGELPPLVAPSGHVSRFVAQVLLLTSLWEMAHPH